MRRGRTTPYDHSKRWSEDTGGEVWPAPPRRDKLGPYASGFASLAVSGYFATSITSGAYSLLAMIQQIGDWRNLSEKIVQWEGVALPAESSTPLKRRIFWRNLYWARRS